MKCDELIINWLNNAYAMENALIKTMEQHAKDAENEQESELAMKLRDHIKETEGQAESLRGRIEELGGKVSEIKSSIASVMGAIQGMSTDIADDKIVKNSIMEYASEYMERAVYKTIATAAEECGDEKTAELCRGIKKEEQNTGEMLDNDLKKIVTNFLNKKMSETEE